MSDTPTSPAVAPQPANAPLSDERQMAMIIYILYLAAFAFPPLAIVGIVLAYVNREDAPDWLKSHYTFQIYTFWLGLLSWVVSFVLIFVVIGFLLLPAVAIWVIIRCALGLNRLMRREAYPNPQTWIT
jgi:uncharacterized membrane protein